MRAKSRTLERLNAGTYGICFDCGGAILPARLKVIADAERGRDCPTTLEFAQAADGARDRRPAPYPADEEPS